MFHFCLKNKGTISVFLTLILIPTFVFGGIMIDGSRILGAKNIVSGAGDLALNGALSNYYDELNNVYGMLAMADTAEEVSSTVQDFFETSLNAAGVTQENFNKALVYLELTSDFSVSNLPGSEIFQTEPIKKEILEYMKYRAPVTLLQRNILGKLGDLNNIEELRDAADKEIKFEKSLNDMQKLFDETKEKIEEEERIYKVVKNESQLNSLLNESKETYKEITMLAVAYRMMTNGNIQAREGEPEGLMLEMIDLDCNMSTIDAYVASTIIKMLAIQKGVHNPSDILEGLNPESYEYKEKQRIINEYSSAEENCAEGVKNTEKQLNKLILDNYKVFSKQHDEAKNGYENCEDILKKTKKIKDEFGKVKEKYDAWKDAVNNISDEETRAEYNESIKKYKDILEKGGTIESFEKKINNNKDYYAQVVQGLDTVRYGDYYIDQNVKHYSDISIGEYSSAKFTEADQIINAGKDLYDKRYRTADQMNLSTSNIDISSDQFVYDIKNVFCKVDDGNKAEANKATDNWKSELEKTAKELKNLMTSDDLPKKDMLTISKNDIPSVWLGSSLDGGEAETKVKATGGLKDKDSRQSAAQSGEDSLNADNGDVSGLAKLSEKVLDLGEKAVEPVIMTEYVMNMFSHYTCNKDIEGKDVKPETISRAPMENNAFYRAELEYILWGKTGNRANVNITKSIIFAINFVFNMTFVFTNRELRSQAETVANFFPVGVLGRFAIKCALQTMVATIETTSNMLDLMKGFPVPLVKDKSHWKTWILPPSSKKVKHDIGFTYDDYIWVLTCMKMFIPSIQTAMLARTADCIEVNLTNEKKNNEKTLKDKFTLVEIQTDVKVDTFFMPKLSRVGYGVDADENAFTLHYYGVQGY